MNDGFIPCNQTIERTSRSTNIFWNIKNIYALSDRYKIYRNINIYALSARHCGPHPYSMKNRSSIGVMGCFFLRNLPTRALDSRAQGFSPPLARLRLSYPRRIWCLLIQQCIQKHACACCGAVPGFPRQCSLPLARTELAEESHLVNTIFNQLNRCRVSTNRLNREDTELVTSLRGESSPKFAGKTLSYAYPKTRFRRKRARRSKKVF